MKLLEFFGKNININTKSLERTDANNIADDLFWYILDHDRLHKDYFFPIANKIKGLKDCGTSQILELYMPMVKKGCKEYYQKNNMKGKLGKIFPEDMREELCNKLHEHYSEDINKDRYKIGS